MKRFVLLISAAGLLHFVAGCATTSDSEEAAAPTEPNIAAVAEAVQLWKSALESQNVEGALPAYSDRFRHAEYGDKAGILSYLQEAKLDGYLEGIFVDSTHADIRVLGNQAVVYPLQLTGKFGTILYRLNYVNEDGTWRIIGSDAASI